MRSLIEALRPRSGDWRHLCITASGVALIIAAYDVGLNRNQVFVAILTALFVSLSVFATDLRRAIAIITAGTLLAAFPMPLAPLQLSDPAMVTDRVSGTTALPAGEVWQYSFTLTDIDDWHYKCGRFEPLLYIDGMGLNESSVDVAIDAASLRDQPKFVKSNVFDEIQLPIDLTDVRRFNISLMAKPNAKPSIRVAPETDGTIIYSDAVFLELKNPKCTIIYETTRRVVPRKTI